MYPRNSIFSRPSRGPNSQDWSQTQDSQDWADSQEIMRVPATPQIRRQMIRNNNQVVPSSQQRSRLQTGGMCNSVEVSSTEDAREMVARDLRFGLHMILNLVKELPEKMKQDVTEVVQSQSSQQEELKTHLDGTKERLETLINNIEEKLNKLLENTENSQTLQTTLSQKEEMILSLEEKLGNLEEVNNKEQKEWFAGQLQDTRKELKKQLKKCQEGIQSISIEKGLQSINEVINTEFRHLEDTLQEKFIDLSKENKIQIGNSQRNMEEQLNNMKTLVLTKIDDHYRNIKEMLPEMVAKQFKVLEKCKSRPPLNDISNTFVIPRTHSSTSQGYSKENFYKSSPIATVKPLVKRETETQSDWLTNTNHNLIHSSCDYQRSSVAKNVRKAIPTPQSEITSYKRVCRPDNQLHKAEIFQNIYESKCNKSKFDIKKDKTKILFTHDIQKFNEISSKTQKNVKKLAMPNYSSDSEEDSGLLFYVTSADEEDTDIVDISTPSGKPCIKLLAPKYVSNSKSQHNVKHVNLHKSRTQDQIKRNGNSL